jgi:zinc transport system substrate-binding protein
MESMMSRKLLSLSVSAMALAGAAQADAPRVATDIAPVHALVARVMDGVGAPDLIIQKGASPHAYNLRPSEAGALQEAEILFWIGPDLTPWMEDAAETLAGGAQIVTLLDLPKTTRLEFREGALFEAHAHEGEHGHDHEHEAGHDHDHDHAKADHDHEHEADHEHEHEHEHKAGHDHDHDHEGHKHDDHAHAHGDHDPHAWLSPANAAAWLDAIAATLSEADPENAATYAANASAGKAELDALTNEVAQRLDPVRGRSFIVFHDAYQYFEDAFGLRAAGAISLSDATDPSPARIAEIQGRIQDEGIDCVLAEPQFNPGIVTTVTQGTQVATGVLDPLGSDLELGPDFYPALITDMANSLAECLSGGA